MTQPFLGRETVSVSTNLHDELKAAPLAAG